MADSGTPVSQTVQLNVEENQTTECHLCNRSFRTNRGLLQHLHTCRRRNNINESSNISDSIVNNEARNQEQLEQQENFYWNNIPGSVYQRNLEEAYEQIVYWRKNVFMVPTGAAGKKFIDETSRLLDQWTNNTPLKNIALKAIHVMPALLLQKPSKTSKAKDHLKALERRIRLWEEGNITELVNESKAIQERLPSNNTPMNIEKLSSKFKQLMQTGNVNRALRLLTNNMSNGVLPLSDETLQLLKLKHPEARDAQHESLLQGPVKLVHNIVFEDINESIILKAAIKTKGGCGPSGFDADNWRRIFASKQFGSSSLDLRKSFAEFVKSLCITNIHLENSGSENSLEAFTANRLIPLNKNPGLRPIGVGEVLRRIAGKVVMYISKKDVKEAAGSLQVCAGQEAGSEAAVHAIFDIFQNDDTEAVLLVDADNAFNSINRKAMLHNISIICPIITTFISNCYTKPARLFVVGNFELKSTEGTTQGDPTAMAAYALGVTPLIHFLSEFIKINDHHSKEVAFADDFTVAGKVTEIRSYWDALLQIGPLFGYFPKPSKSYLIVKQQHHNIALETFNDSEVKITTEGKRHLGAVIGSTSFKNYYSKSLVDEWIMQFKLLSKIAESEPQSAYAAFIGGFRGKLTYFMRTIPSLGELLKPLEDVIRFHFIPAITGGHLCSDNERRLLSLPIRFGGLAIPLFYNDAQYEYENSRKLTSSLARLIKEQNQVYTVNESDIKTIKANIKSEKEERHKTTLNEIKRCLSENDNRLNDISQEKGASNWLAAYPISDQGYDLNKQQFWDSIRLRYGWRLANIPSTCSCGSKMDIQHAMSCKKGGFVTIRHNNVRDLTANLLNEVCNDVNIEPQLLPVTGERFNNRTANVSNEARVDIKSRGFWVRGQQAFFDVRVFDPNAKRYLHKALPQCYTQNEKEKKRQYNERILEVEHGSFTPLVFSIYGGMGRECSMFYNKLSQKISEKKDIHKSIATNWIRTKLSFALLKSALLCIRGSRSLDRKVCFVDDDIKIAHEVAKI